MAVLRFPPTDRRIEDESEIRLSLAALGIDYERWDLSRVGADASADAVLTAYAREIEQMKQRGGYVTADVIDVSPETPGLDAMLARFDKEHTHSEDEVRFILCGRGVFFLHFGEKVVSFEVGPGDMLRVPCGTTHCLLCVKTAASAPFAGFRTLPAGRPTTPIRASTRPISRSASGRLTLVPA